MSSIIKVDTIQNQSGANIISESSNVITVGASGDTITVPSGATLGGAGTVDLSSATVTLNSSMKNTPAFYVAQSSSQSIPNATQTKIQFNQERYDTDNAYDNSTNYRFTVPSGKGGKYFFTYACAFGGFAADKMLYIHLRINGTQQNYHFLKNSTSGDHSVNASSILDLNAGDYVEVFVFHDHGSAKSTDTTTGDKYGVVYFGGYKIIE